MILLHVILVCFVICAHGKKLHEHMTKEEIESVFNCKHDLVHEVEYEVTPILHVNKLDNKGQRFRRADSALHLKAFDKNLTLYLEPNDNLLLGSNTPVFIAKHNREARSLDGEPEIIYSRMQFPMPENMKLYHDMTNRAAVTVRTDRQKRAHVHGTIGDELIIKPVPARLQKEILPMYPDLYQSSFSYRRPNPFSSDSFNDPFSGDSLFGNVYEPTHHIVIKPKVHSFSAYYDPMEGRWKKINSDSDKIGGDLRDPFISWKNSFDDPYIWNIGSQLKYPWRPYTRRPIHRPSNNYREPYPWRQPTQKPWKLPLVTRDPWPRITDDPFVYRPATDRPSTRDPVTSRPYTRRPLPSRSTTLRPYSTRNPDISPSTAKSTEPIAEKSDTAYPELLVSVDYDTYAAHGSDIKELSEYMAAFWNAVDLRFREMSEPKVRINIAGLIIPKTRDSVPYLEKYRVGSDALKAEETVREVGEYFAKEDQFPKNMYDIAVAISHRDLGSYNTMGKFESGTTGIAMFEGACHVQTGQAAALIRDKGGFNGITTAAHELAHSLGAPHDGSDTKDTPGGPCSWDDGYLMSYKRRDSKGMHWSKCSITAMRIFMKSEAAQCLKNKPNAGKAYPKILPGRILSRDEQCSRTLGAGWSSFTEKESNCAVLHCQKRISDTQISTMTELRPPAEGSYCGEGAICLDAQCVKDSEAS